MEQLRSRLAALRARIEAGHFGTRVSAVVEQWTGGVRRLRGAWRRATAPLRTAGGAVTGAGRTGREALRPGRAPVRYRDGMVTLDDDGVVISAYYVPFGRRRIAYDRIHGFEDYPLSGGREFRVHGFGWPRQWYHRDANRAQRTVGLLLHTDGLLSPVLTPADPDAVRTLLAARCERR